VFSHFYEYELQLIPKQAVIKSSPIPAHVLDTEHAAELKHTHINIQLFIMP